MLRWTRGFFAAAVAVTLAATVTLPAAALQFEPSPDGSVIRAHGPITAEDAGALKRLLDTDPRYRFGPSRGSGVTLQLNSPGGSVVGGIELANLVRARGLATHVPADAGCFSACTFVFIGGVRRVVEGKFGIHAMSKSGQHIIVYSDTDLDAVQQLTSTLINLAETLIGDARMISAMLTVPGASIRLVSDDLLAEWRVITHAARPAQRMKTSFDCSGSKLGDVDRMVCDHLQLADADRRIAAAYAWLSERKADENLSADQERWRSYRDSCRHVPGPTPDFGLLSCVTEAYTLRLRQLEGLRAFHEAAVEGPAAAGWKEHAPIADVLMIRQ